MTFDPRRAVRLVVDKRLHARHATTQQFIDYCKDNAAATETDIVDAIDCRIG